MTLDAAKAAVLLFVATIVQVTLLNGVTPLGGTPDLVLLLVVAIALLRGAVFGAVSGFLAGFLVDTATLQTLGVTSLLLTLAGYWTGRYGETAARDRSHAPLLAVAAVTVLYAFAALALRFVLGLGTSAEAVLLEALPAGLVWNLLLAAPVYTACRALLAPPVRADGAEGVKLLG